MLDLETLQVHLGPFGNEVRAIIRDDGVQDPISGNDIVPDKLFCCHSNDCLIRGYFHPLGKAVDRHEDEAVTIRGCRMDCSNNVTY